MAEDWAVDVRKYAPDADESVIKGIVRYCGIALQSRDASLVSFTDPAETDRVRENFCRKKLGLTGSDAELDAAIARVGERMSADSTRNRVTVYYLLAEMFGKLGLFGAAEATAAPVAETPAPSVPDPQPVMVAAPAAPAPPVASVAAVPAAAVTAAAATPAAAATMPQARSLAHARPAGRVRDDGGIVATALTVLGALAVIIIAAATAGMFLGNSLGGAPGASPAPVAVVADAVPAAPAVEAAPPAAPAIPTGSGVIAQDVEGKPQVSVYFDTASADISPDFAAAAAPIKAYMDANPGARLAVSGYNDPRGGAAFNAELSKNRAQSVAAALAALGIPAAAIDLEKPAETTDTTTSLENARRVDIMVKDG